MFSSMIGGLFILLAIYALAATSGLFAERSGTINLAINGGMIMGAVGYVMTVKLLHTNGQDIKWWMTLVGLIVGMLFSIAITSLLSIAAINFMGDQVIIGTAINVLAPIISLLIIISISNGQQFLPTTDYQIITVFPQSSPLEAWQIQGIIAGVVAVVILLLWVIMKFTSFGLRLRAAGENPHALAASGVSVITVKHLSMIISGALAGLAGGLAVSSFIKFSSYTSGVFGMGYIALAILILGQWRLHWIILGAIAFSGIYIVAYQYAPQVGEYKWYIYMIPYLSILITLPLFSMKSKAPKAVGIPYQNTGR